jgi:hypothetical protein
MLADAEAASNSSAAPNAMIGLSHRGDKARPTQT